jgi:uncharacterized cupin superfamily protein
MAIRKLAAATDAPSPQLNDWGAVGAPLSEPACRLRGDKMTLPLPGGPDAGVWECSPGRYRRQIRSAELMHILAGEAVFTPDGGGAPITLRAGDLLFFEAETLGTWDIRASLRKVYLVFHPG